jgi:hypothetical protein
MISVHHRRLGMFEQGCNSVRKSRQVRADRIDILTASPYPLLGRRTVVDGSVRPSSWGVVDVGGRADIAT